MKSYLFFTFLLLLYSCNQKNNYTTKIDYNSSKIEIFSDTVRTTNIPSSSKAIIENFESVINLHYTADYQTLDEYSVAIDKSFYFLKEFYDILKNNSQAFPKKIRINNNNMFVSQKTKGTNQIHLVSNSGQEIVFNTENNDIVEYREKFYFKGRYNSPDGSITDESLDHVDRQLNFIYDSNRNALKKEYKSLTETLISPDVIDYKYYTSSANPNDYYIWICRSPQFETERMIKVLHVRNNKLFQVYHCVERNGNNDMVIKRGSLVEEDDQNRISSYETEPNLTDTTSYGNYDILSGIYYFSYNDDKNISKISRVDENNETIDEIVYKYLKKNNKLYKYEVSRITNNTSQPIRSVEILK